MGSKATATQTDAAAGPGQHRGLNQDENKDQPGRGGEKALKSYSITHLRRSQPGKVQIDRINASDDTDAKRRAAQHFPDSTILRICRARKDKAVADTQNASGNEDLPNARFIRGEFRPADTEDEPALRDLCS